MAKRDSTRVLWRVQVRKSRAHKWVNKGTFETRSCARLDAWWWREGSVHMAGSPFGFGNTRVLRVEKAR